MARDGVKIRFPPGDDVAINAVDREEYEDESFILYILQNYGEIDPFILIHVATLQLNYILNVRSDCEAF